MKKLISIIIPVFNEEKNIPLIYVEIINVWRKHINLSSSYDCEVIFVNDGSEDNSLAELEKISERDERVKIIDFSRNFGKEMAVTAGINHCRGSACLSMDADLQHPAELNPEFIAKWEKGAEVVIGIRKKNKGEGLVKKIGSYFFYKIINGISRTKIIPNATDFRLLDRIVINEFNKLSEKNRMTRALIDWMGFKRDYVYFSASERLHGKASYNFLNLVRLAFNSIISLSLFPLKLAGYLGIVITLLSGSLGIFIFIEDYVLDRMEFSGPAILAVIILFLVGIILICLGLMALYIANIHTEVINRPMYIVRKSNVKVQMSKLGKEKNSPSL